MRTYEIDYTADFAWVASAVSKEEIRYMISGVKIETQEDGKRRLIATDGKRMHILENYVGTSHVQDGLYKVVFTKKKQGEPVMLEEIDATFPKWQAAVPDAEKFTHKAVIEPSIVRYSEKIKESSFIFEVISCGIAVPTAFLLDLDKAGVTAWVMYTQDKIDGFHAVKFVSRNGNHTAVMMPSKVEPVKLVKVTEG